MKPVSCIAILAFSVTSIIAQDVPGSPGSRPVVLLPGLGRHQHPIVTASPEAQKFFDQGLIMVYAFNRGEAIRSFQRAAELDPQSPMPYWGIALAHGFHLNMDFDKDVHSKAAFEAIQKAVTLSVHSSQQEREYVAALANRCSADPHSDERKLALDYKNAMEELAAHYPDDQTPPHSMRKAGWIWIVMTGTRRQGSRKWVRMNSWCCWSLFFGVSPIIL